MSLVVSGAFLFTGVAFAQGEEAAAPEAAPEAATAAPATTGAAPTKAPRKVRVRPTPAKAAPEAAKKMDECRNTCLTSKSTGDDRLTCFFECRKSIKGFVPPYAGFKPCFTAAQACRRDTCKIAGAKLAGLAGAKVAHAVKAAVKHGQGPAAGPGKRSAAGPGKGPAAGPGKGPAGAKKPGYAKMPGHKSPGAGLSDEARKCLEGCRTTHKSCLSEVLGKATPGSATAATATPETKTEEKAAETPAAAETKTEEKAAEGASEEAAPETP